jgi:hypothetical protein
LDLARHRCRYRNTWRRCPENRSETTRVHDTSQYVHTRQRTPMHSERSTPSGGGGAVSFSFCSWGTRAWRHGHAPQAGTRQPSRTQHPDHRLPTPSDGQGPARPFMDRQRACNAGIERTEWLYSGSCRVGEDTLGMGRGGRRRTEIDVEEVVLKLGRSPQTLTPLLVLWLRHNHRPGGPPDCRPASTACQ